MKKLLLILICLITVFSILVSSVLSLGALSPPTVARFETLNDFSEFFVQANKTEEEYEKYRKEEINFNKHGLSMIYYDRAQVVIKMFSNLKLPFPKDFDIIEAFYAEGNITYENPLIIYTVNGVKYKFRWYYKDDDSKSIDSIYEGKNVVVENLSVGETEVDLWKYDDGSLGGMFDIESVRFVIEVKANQTENITLDWLKLDTVDNVIPEIQAWQEEKAKAEETTDREENTDDKKSCAGITALSVHLLLITAIAAAFVINKK